MRPFKGAAIAANKHRLANGRDRWDTWTANARSETRRVDLLYDFSDWPDQVSR